IRRTSGQSPSVMASIRIVIYLTECFAVDETDVGVDAVLSADVDDAPIRQREYTAPVHAPLAQPSHESEQHTRDRSRRVGRRAPLHPADWIDTPTWDPRIPLCHS